MRRDLLERAQLLRMNLHVPALRAAPHGAVFALDCLGVCGLEILAHAVDHVRGECRLEPDDAIAQDRLDIPSDLGADRYAHERSLPKCWSSTRTPMPSAGNGALIIGHVSTEAVGANGLAATARRP